MADHQITTDLHVRLKDRDTWAEFYNDDRDIEVFYDAANNNGIVYYT